MEIVGFDRIARYYLSHTHLEAAVRLAGLCEDAEQHWTGTYEKGMYTHLKDSKMFAIGTIISAVCFLESTVNELFADSIEPQKRLKDIAPDKLAMLGVFQNQFLKNQSGPSLLNRFQLALACICGEVFDRGTSPYQNVDLIISLRNALVHASPENISLEQEVVLQRESRKGVKKWRLKGDYGSMMSPCRKRFSLSQEWTSLWL